jgi:hypothetical protein
MTAELINIFLTVIALPAGGALVGALIKGRLEDSRLFKLRGTRNIAGRWNGHLHIPNVSREKLTFDFSPSTFFNHRFWFNPKLVMAKVTIEDEIIECRGGFCTEEYLMMDYRAAEQHVFQFGSMVLKLDAAGTGLEGDLIGYYNEPYVARLVLKKERLKP